MMRVMTVELFGKPKCNVFRFALQAKTNIPPISLFGKT
jgi:hypothetical protein